MKSNKILVVFIFIIITFSLFACVNNDYPENPKDDIPERPNNVYIENDLFTHKTDKIFFTEDEIISESVDGIIYSIRSWAYYEDEIIDSSFEVSLSIKFDDVADNAGIIFGASAPEDGQFSAYAVMMENGILRLLKIEATDSEIMHFSLIQKTDIHTDFRNFGCTLKIQYHNSYIHIYAARVGETSKEPVMKLPLSDFYGNGVGIADNGCGVKYNSFEVKQYNGENHFKYTNPVYTESQAADPCVIYYDGLYYCYSTSSSVGYCVYTSADLVNWENRGLCCGAAWGFDEPRGMYWAPEVIERDGKFYMVLSVEEHIGFAVADSPLGPFIPEETWTIDKAIDGHFFIDDDGQAYLYYVTWRSGKRYGIYGCELEDDMVTIREGTEKLLIYPTEDWEKVAGSVTEGPYILKHEGTYYLTYSGTGYTAKEYAVGYATSDSPLGDYTKYSQPILKWTDEVYGPGHHAFTYSPDGSELFIVYHAHRTPSQDGSGIHPRVLCIDRAKFIDSSNDSCDILYIYGPTSTPQDYPSSDLTTGKQN